MYCIKNCIWKKTASLALAAGLSSLVCNKGTSLSLPVPFYHLCVIGFLPASQPARTPDVPTRHAAPLLFLIVKQISAVIREKGYDGADETIRMFATRERRLMKESAAQGGTREKIERKWLISLLYRPVDEVSSLSQEQLDRIIEEYPIIYCWFWNLTKS